ncbi:DUF4190 domain-containing protein [Sinomonas sp. P47F7]|uniref:DUF4190 domain-containing protein n=1 Tax=Sinomonas sp. P47F7 TaxID=3410987 RepID=UPI003BF52EA1
MSDPQSGAATPGDRPEPNEPQPGEPQPSESQPADRPTEPIHRESRHTTRPIPPIPHAPAPPLGQTPEASPEPPRDAPAQPGYGQGPYSQGAYYQQPQYNQPQYSQPQYNQPLYSQPQQSPYSYPAQPYAYAPPEPRGLSIASMVCGIASLLGFGVFLLPQVAAVILGHLALSREPAGRGFAIAGLATGYFCLLITVAILAFIAIGIASVGSYHSGY